MTHVDLNGDLGEGLGSDAELMPLLTSVNIACGAHAGDEPTMRRVASLAHRHGVAVGAHPGYDDREHFGRREVPMSSSALRDLVARQIMLLRGMTALRHVKPHGALYNLAARDRAVADVVAGAVREVDRSLILFALAGSELVHAGRARGLIVAQEVFADRTYRADGSLTPRSEKNAVHQDERDVILQVIQMIRTGTVRATDGSDVRITADTICLHGDGPHAVKFATILRRALQAEGIDLHVFNPG